MKVAGFLQRCLLFGTEPGEATAKALVSCLASPFVDKRQSMLVRPLTDNSRRLLEKRRHVLIGVSPFNSYFSEATLQELAAWGRENFEAMHLFIPDFPTTYTLLALGYSSKDANWKARRQARYVINKTQRALEAAGFSRENAADNVLTWEKVAANARYQALLKEASEVYESDPAFRKDCQDVAWWVLEKRVGTATARTDVNLELAAKYLLSEMPLLVDTPGILEKESSLFAYHQCPALLDRLYRGQYCLRPSDDQGFVLVTCPENIEAEQGMFI
jgi:cyclo(L-tyrosyl-L-tyrosyl) synthase